MNKHLLCWVVLALGCTVCGNGCGKNCGKDCGQGPPAGESEGGSAQTKGTTEPLLASGGRPESSAEAQSRSQEPAQPARQPTPAANPIAPSALTLATYNINWGNPNLPQIAAIIRKAQADLVLLQETTAESEAYLGRELAGDYPVRLSGGDRGRLAAERFGILSKLPVEGLRYVPPQHGLFGAWIGHAEWAGRKIQFVNVHLQPLVPGAVWELLDDIQKAEQIHQKEIEQVVGSVSLEAPTLIAGDFNSMSQFAAPKYLVARGLADSFASVTKDPDAHPTWHWPTRPIPAAARIDYIFHTRHFRTLDSQILVSEASDHYLLVSRLRWEEPSAKLKTSPKPPERP